MGIPTRSSASSESLRGANPANTMSDKDKVIAGSASFRKHPMPAPALSIRLPPVRRWCDEVFRRLDVSLNETALCVGR